MDKDIQALELKLERYKAKQIEIENKLKRKNDESKKFRTHALIIFANYQAKKISEEANGMKQENSMLAMAKEFRSYVLSSYKFNDSWNEDKKKKVAEKADKVVDFVMGMIFKDYEYEKNKIKEREDELFDLMYEKVDEVGNEFRCFYGSFERIEEYFHRYLNYLDFYDMELGSITAFEIVEELDNLDTLNKYKIFMRAYDEFEKEISDKERLEAWKNDPVVKEGLRLIRMHPEIYEKWHVNGQFS